MKNLFTHARYIAGLAFSVLAGCGASDGTESRTDEFNPPSVKQGYTRFVAPTIAGVAPGDDVTYCQYVQAPLDYDVDILDIQGYQSRAGHHAVAYATPAHQPVGSSAPCSGEDNVAGAFIGGIGGEGGGGIVLPEGVAFRLHKGHSIMLNTHFLNAGQSQIDGETVLDIKFVPVDSQRKVASMFTNVHVGFQLPAHAGISVTTECVFPRDVQFLSFTNHMHEYGTHAITHLVRAGTTEPQLVHEDPAWTYEMQFNAVYTQWDLANPFTVRKGDVLRTQCNWNNTTGDAIQFPREMCVGVGFFLSDGTSSPNCVNGSWIERQSSL